MLAAFSPEGLARAATRHPWRVVAVWAVLVVVGFGLAAGFNSIVINEQKVYTDLDSQTAKDLLERFHGPEPVDEFVVLQSKTTSATDAAFQTAAEALISQARATAHVANVTSYYEVHDPSLVSADGRTLMVPVRLEGKVEDSANNVKGLVQLVKGADGKNGLAVAVGGTGSINDAFASTAKSDLARGEFRVGLPIAAIVLVFVFGALVAAGLPLLLGILSIGLAVGITALIGHAIDVSTYAENLITMVGLAVGIDYTLLIIQRFREERRRGLERDDAIVKAGGTASRAVLFSGMAVIVALAGMILVPDSIFRSLGMGAVVVVVVAVAAALTLLPALLRLLGDRVNIGTIPFRGGAQADESGAGGGWWTRQTNFVMKHAVLSVIVSVGVLLAAASPYLTMKIGSSGVASLPASSSPHRAFDLLNSEFNAGVLTPTDIVISAPNVNVPTVNDAIQRTLTSISADASFGTPTLEVSPQGDIAHIAVAIKGDSQSKEAVDALHRLRANYLAPAFAGTGAKSYVGGYSAQAVDYANMIDRYTPIVFAFVLGVSFLILLVVFRSIVVPIKAIVMNLLSVGAAYGLMVLVFQHGVGAGALGFTQVDRIESWVPLFMFALLFGLSMDYHVFLLSRIRERYEHTHDNAASVAYGVRTTAGMITGAALIMVAVFAGFALADLPMFQQMGFGLAVAVALDATIVRSILVPASMALLGNANWYLPSWLGWLPHVSVEGRADAPASGGRGAMPEGAVGQ